MPFDEGLAHRVREALAGAAAVGEKRMFGGLCFMLSGHMALGITDETLMVRVGPQAEAEALCRPGARPMDFTGRPLKGYVYVDPSGLTEDANLAWWVERARLFVLSLPPKDGRPARVGPVARAKAPASGAAKKLAVSRPGDPAPDPAAKPAPRRRTGPR